jgi:hypothetical protein
LVTFSEQFDNAAWTKSGSSITANAAISPDGFINADKIVENSANSSHTAFHDIAVASGSIYTLSVFAKSAERTRVWVDLFGGVTSANFDLTNGTILAFNAGVTAKIENYGNGWYRCSITAAAPNVFVYPNIGPVTSSTTSPIYQGNGTSGIFVWGAQLELGSYVSSYIPTLGSSVTRLADAASKTGISSLIGQTQGTLFLEVDAVNFATDQRFSISDGTSVNRIALRMATGGLIQLSVVIGNTTQASIFGSGSVGNTYKIAGAYKENDFVMYINGILAGTDTSGSVSGTFSRLATDNGFGGQDFYNPIKQALLFKTRLTNAELASITTL